jgi:hypothetical protein
MHIALHHCAEYTDRLENAPEETEVDHADIGACHRCQEEIIGHPNTHIAFEAARRLLAKISSLPSEATKGQYGIIRTHLTHDQLKELGL